MSQIADKNSQLVSIAIPVYNGSNYLREAIDSALAQTYKNVEVIVVNDGSTDNTEEIANSYGDKIRYFYKENGGVSSALNLALQKMKGEYFSWLSHDDVYYPEKVQKQIEFIDKLENKKVVLYSDYEFIDKKSQVIGTMVLDHNMLEKKHEYAILRSSINGNTLLIPKKAFDETGDFDVDLRCTQDYAKWFEMIKSYNFVHVPEILIKYRIHESQDTNKNPKFICEGNLLWKKMMLELPIERKKLLEGNEFGFYREMSDYLKNTPFKEAFRFSNNRMVELIDKKRNKSCMVSFISHSAELSGAERALLDTLDALSENGVFSYVILPRKGNLEKELSSRNIYYEILDLPWWANVDLLEFKKVNKMISLNAIILALKLKILNPDIVFTNTSVINVGAIAAKILGIPHVWNISEFGKKEHGVDYMLNEDQRMKFINDYSDKVFVVSRALAEEYRGKVAEKKIILMPNIVQIDREIKYKKYFSSGDDILKVIVLGNITPGKGQKDAILAVRELLKRNKKVELIIAGTVGSETYYRELMEIILGAKMKQAVRIIGFIEDARNLIAESDIVLVCSIFEGFGRVTAEGMLFEKPIIGARSGATSELIEEKNNGFLYEPGNFDELADRIEFFIDRREEISRMGKNGYNFAKKNFNKKNFVEKILNEFKTIMENRKEKSLTSSIAEIAEKIEQIKKEINKEELLFVQMKKEIDSMKNSKFWKLRGFYMNIKRIFKF